MDEVYHAKPLSMTFCLNCHRDPAMHLRPLNKITDLDWVVTKDTANWAPQQLALGQGIMHDWHVQSLQNCSTCHR
jgi:RecB family exonuclease